jgi:hypothetical protein
MLQLRLGSIVTNAVAISYGPDVHVHLREHEQRILDHDNRGAHTYF